MPTTPELSRKYPEDHLAPQKFALVVSCVDCRLLDDLVRFLENDNLTNRYYHVAFAGAAIGLSAAAPTYYPRCDAAGKPTGDPLDFSNWKQTLYDHLELVLKLTGNALTDVYIVEHADCGAYRAFLNVDYYEHPTAPDLDAEREEHRARAEALAAEMVAWFESEEAAKVLAPLGGAQTPLVRGFLMDLRGNVERLFDPTTSVPR